MVTRTTVRGGASSIAAMSFDEYVGLGETKHTAYYDHQAHVNPPTRRHVQVARRLTRALEDAVPAAYEVLPEAGWLVAAETVLVPDIMVARRDAPGPDLLEQAPLLVVEVLSPSTRSEDRGRKRELYAQGGAAWYWLLDLDAREIQVLRAEQGRFVEQRVASGGLVRFEEPFGIAVDLAVVFPA